MSDPALQSKTPILDLEESLSTPPVPHQTVKATIFLCVIAVFVFRSLVPVWVLTGYLVVSLAAAVVHEFGHWLAGYCVGLHLSYLVVGPFKFVRRSGRWRLFLRSRMTGGLILMSLDKVRRVRRRLIVWTVGGAIASLLSGLAALIACRAEIIGGNPWIGLPAAGYAIVSLAAGIQSLRNVRVGGYASDGVLLRILLKNHDGAKQQIAAHALNSIRNRDLDLSLWNRRWISLAAAPSEACGTTFHADWLQYRLASDPGVAAEYLERSLSGLALLPPDSRDEHADDVFLEAAFFMAWYRRDPQKGQTWFDRVVRPEFATEISRRKVQMALSCAREDFDDALQQLDQGLKSLDQLRTCTRVEILRAQWNEWGSEIRAKRTENASREARSRALLNEERTPSSV